jgi:hypothetical protein
VLQAAVLQGADRPNRNKAHLAEMPGADRVMREIQYGLIRRARVMPYGSVHMVARSCFQDERIDMSPQSPPGFPPTNNASSASTMTARVRLHWAPNNADSYSFDERFRNYVVQHSSHQHL